MVDSWAAVAGNWAAVAGNWAAVVVDSWWGVEQYSPLDGVDQKELSGIQY